MWPQLTERVTSDDAVIEARVQAILERVRKDGDKALTEIASEIDKADLSAGIEVTAEEIDMAAVEVSDELKASIANAYENIYAFHNAQSFSSIEVQTAPGVKCIQKAMPIQKVGLYIPGGSAPLFSTVLMLAIPAKVAGCREVVLCTPCSREGKVASAVLYAAKELEKSYDKIKELSDKKSESYKKAYRYLEAANNVRAINSRLVLPVFKEEKARRAVDRIFAEIKCGGGYALSVGMICSVGMKGRVRFDTYEHFADKVYLVEDHFDMGCLYLRLLVKKAMESDTPVRVSYDPVCTDRLSAVFFPNDRKAFVLSEKDAILSGDVTINMQRFADKAALGEIRSEYRLNSKLYEALISSAEEALKRAGECHFELENIYVSCMDFAAQEVFCKNFLNNLLN